MTTHVRSYILWYAFFYGNWKWGSCFSFLKMVEMSFLQMRTAMLDKNYDWLAGVRIHWAEVLVTKHRQRCHITETLLKAALHTIQIRDVTTADISKITQIDR